MSSTDRSESLTPVHRRLLRTNVPGVYKRGGRYVAITQHRGKRVKSYHRTKAEARVAKAERTAGARPTSRERFEDYAERWLVEYTGRTARGLAPSTRAAYGLMFRTHVIPYFRGERIGDIGPMDVKHFITHLTTVEPRHSQHGATRLAGSTIRRIMTPLKAMLAEAYELEVIRTNPARVRIIVPGDRVRSRPRTMSTEQVAAVLEQLSDRDRILFWFLSRTGLRISEALGLQWRDVQDSVRGAVVAVAI